MKLLQLLYASTAVHTLSKAELLDILDSSRKNNEEMGVTGLLLYTQGNFMQVLEGEQKNVIAIFNKVSKDTRHKGIILLLKEEVSKREFPNWSMAFKNGSDPYLENYPGYSNFLNHYFQDMNLIEMVSPVKYFISQFRMSMR